MANQYINFLYDPSKQGYSNTEWHTIIGDVAVSGGQLILSKAEAIHYGDVLRGDFHFVVTLETPVLDDNIKIGLIQYNKNEYAYFKIDQGVLSAEVSNGTDTVSHVIPWVADWSGVKTDFRIKWEAGMVTFYIGGQFKYTHSGIEVPNDVMSLYLASDSINTFLLDYIVAKGVQSFIMSTGNSNSSFEIMAYESDRMHITENITSVTTLPDKSVSENTSITENVSVQVS